jgi:predicted AlkP superfamily pyrophosphatase or phosphodiesterase
MVEAQEVIARIRADTQGLRPHYEHYSLLSVPATIQELFGLDGYGLRAELGLPRAEKVVSIVVDGLGYNKLESLRAAGKVNLSLFLSHGSYIPLTSVFPPTTTTALTSLATGVSPIIHGVLGYKLFLQDPGAVVNMIKLSTPGGADNSLEKLGIKLDKFIPVPTLYQRLSESGVSTTLFLPKHITDSGLSHVLYQGVGETVPFISLSDLFMLLGERMAKPGKKFFSVYWPVTDTLAHMYGPNSSALSSEVALFFRLLSDEFLRRAKGVVVLVTADHGFRNIDPARDVIFCPDHPTLKEGLLFPPVGDSRAAYLYLRRGHEESVRSFFNAQPEEFLLLTPEEALARSLFGLERPSAEEKDPLFSEMRARLGDLIVLCTGNRVIIWEKDFKLRGMHGGLTEDELLVPLLAVAL